MGRMPGSMSTGRRVAWELVIRWRNSAFIAQCFRYLGCVQVHSVDNSVRAGGMGGSQEKEYLELGFSPLSGGLGGILNTEVV